jgi:Mlc titration factor MtfA (ptsG expression regulator)
LSRPGAGGAFDGTPELRARAHYRPWAQVMSRNYLALRRGARRARKVLRRYGGTNEAEFFAVATEAFFEKPHQMRKHAPELYAELQRFYRWDPAGVG